MCRLKDFTVETCFIGNWLIVAIRLTVDLNNLCLEPISSNHFVFVIFKVSLIAASHTRILSKSRFIIQAEKFWRFDWLIGSPFPLDSGITAIYRSKNGWQNKVTMTTLNTTSFLVLFSKKWRQDSRKCPAVKKQESSPKKQ